MLLKEFEGFGPLLSDQQLKNVQQVIADLSPTQVAWVSGYLAAASQQSFAQPQSTPQASATLTVLYGSQTGNAKGVAELVAQQAKSSGLSVNLVSMADFKPANIKKETHLVIITSTHGEGEPPEDAEALHSFLASKRAPALDALQYSVLGLGDSSYEFFCKTAQDFDERLSALGAKPVLDRVDCDVDYEDDASAWSQQLLDILKKDMDTKGTSQVIPLPVAESVSSQYSKSNPFKALVLTNQKITGRNSSKNIRHLELSLEDSGIRYQPGDALGVWFDNSDDAVNEIINLLGLDSDTTIEFKGESLTLVEALKSKLEITQSYPGFVQYLQGISQSEELGELISDKSKLRQYLSQKQIVEVLKDFPTQLSAQQLVDGLRAITPRLYSIASSQAEVDEEVHLTVAVVDDERDGVNRQGGASGFLNSTEADVDSVNVYVEQNNHFRLPNQADAPVIMIGPGTGIAPFRAFLQQQAERGSEGQNWLFFGNPHFTEDFLYQTELQQYLKSGVLTRLETAFSRDQQDKIYVQHRLLENGKDVFEWLEKGAYIYVCGDAQRMAKDVHQALVEIISTHGDRSGEQAEQYLKQLKSDHRYQKDVY